MWHPPFWMATVTLLVGTFPTPAQQSDSLNPNPPLPAPMTLPRLRQWKVPQGLNLMQQEAKVCAIPLTEVPVSKKLERMPVVRPPAVDIDPLIQAKVPAPPCNQTLPGTNTRPPGTDQ